MGEFGFGKAFGMLDKPDNHFIIHAIAASNMRTSIYCQFPALSKLKLEKILYPRGSAMRKKFLDLTREFAEQRVSGGKESKNDLFRFVVDAKDPETGQGFSMAELWAESKFLIVAGKIRQLVFSRTTNADHFPSAYRVRYLLYCSCNAILLSHTISRGRAEAI